MDGVNLLVVKRGDLIGMYAQRIFIQYGLGWSCDSGFTPHDYVAIEWWGKTKHLEHPMFEEINVESCCGSVGKPTVKECEGQVNDASLVMFFYQVEIY